MTDENGWQRLARLSTERRRRLGLTQSAIAAAGGPSDAWQRKISTHDDVPPSVRELTPLARFDRALRWPRGTSHAILVGGDVPSDDVDEIESFTDELADHLRAIPREEAAAKIVALRTLLDMAVTAEQ